MSKRFDEIWNSGDTDVIDTRSKPLGNMRIVCAFAASLFTTSIGARAMAEEHSERQAQIVNGELKVPFSSHKFSAYCFDTLKCRVLYNGRYDISDQGPSRALTDAIRKNLDASWLGIPNFPPPARVTWVAKDGTEHQADVDIAKIFEDQIVLYSQELDVYDVPLDRRFLDPGIVLVVDNRTINVYMKAMIPLLHPTIPDNQYSDFRKDLVLAFSQDY